MLDADLEIALADEARGWESGAPRGASLRVTMHGRCRSVSPKWNPISSGTEAAGHKRDHRLRCSTHFSNARKRFRPARRNILSAFVRHVCQALDAIDLRQRRDVFLVSNGFVVVKPTTELVLTPATSGGSCLRPHSGGWRIALASAAASWGACRKSSSRAPVSFRGKAHSVDRLRVAGSRFESSPAP